MYNADKWSWYILDNFFYNSLLIDLLMKICDMDNPSQFNSTILMNLLQIYTADVLDSLEAIEYKLFHYIQHSYNHHHHHHHISSTYEEEVLINFINHAEIVLPQYIPLSTIHLSTSNNPMEFNHPLLYIWSDERNKLINRIYIWLERLKFDQNKINSKEIICIINKLKDIFHLDNNTIIELIKSFTTKIQKQEYYQHNDGSYIIRKKLIHMNNCSIHVKYKTIEAITCQLYDDKNQILTNYTHELCIPLLNSSNDYQIKWQNNRYLIPNDISSNYIWLEIKLLNKHTSTISLLDTSEYLNKPPEYNQYGELTTDGKLQVEHGERLCSNLDVQYIGDIWQKPIAMYESKIAIYILHIIANFINKLLHWENSKEYHQRIYQKNRIQVTTSKKIAPFRIDPILRHGASYFIIAIFMLFISIICLWK